MFIKLLISVLYTVLSIFSSILLLRFYCLLIKFNLKWVGGNLGSFVYKISDWMVLPLRKFIPDLGSADIATLICAFFISFMFNVIYVGLIFGKVVFMGVLLLSIFDLLENCISLLSAIVFISVLLSWFSVNDQMKNLFNSLVNPILWLFRKYSALIISGLDISPFIALFLFQILKLMVGEMKYQLVI
jgi:YggT family protein